MNILKIGKGKRARRIKKPIIFILMVLLVMTHGSCSKKEQEIPINERPMYGGIPPTPAEQKVDQEFIDEVVRKYGSREAASEKALEAAWDWFYKGDYHKAMRRFNQAWLLNPNDPRVFHGYGAALGEMGRADAFVEWNKKSAELGWGNAQVNMGWAYLIGFGVKADPAQAAQWYRKAADQNHPTGLNDLGVLYDWGYGVERDAEQAKTLYKKADQEGFKGDWKKLRRDEFLQQNPGDKDVSFREIVDVMRNNYFSARKIESKKK